MLKACSYRNKSAFENLLSLSLLYLECYLSVFHLVMFSFLTHYFYVFWLTSWTIWILPTFWQIESWGKLTKCVIIELGLFTHILRLPAVFNIFWCVQSLLFNFLYKQGNIIRGKYLCFDHHFIIKGLHKSVPIILNKPIWDNWIDRIGVIPLRAKQVGR